MAAQRFGGVWEEMLGRFVADSEVEILTHLGGYYRVSSAGNRELRRLVEVGACKHLVSSAVATLEVA